VIVKLLIYCEEPLAWFVWLVDFGVKATTDTILIDYCDYVFNLCLARRLSIEQ